MIKIHNQVNKTVALVFDCIGKMIFYSGSFFGLWGIKANKPAEINPRKILVVEEEPLGDVITSTPVFIALKHKFRFARISVITNVTGSRILNNNPYIDEIIVEECPWTYSKQINLLQMVNHLRYLKHYLKLIYILKKERFDLGIELRGDIRNIILFLFLPNIKYTLSYDRTGGAYLLNEAVPFDISQHIIKRKTNLLKRIGIEKADTKMQIYYSPEDFKKREDIFRRYGMKENDFFTIIHPGASQKNRWWFPERYVEVANFVRKKYGGCIILTGTKEELSLTEKISNLMKVNDKTVNLCAKLTIAEVAALLEKAGLLICPDTGIMHLACAFSTPTVAIFGPGDINISGPHQRNVCIVQKKCSCERPCYLRNCKRKINGISACMGMIGVDEVIGAITCLLENTKKNTGTG
ncbi:MAG: glycosyltransferase family 9 protein [Candidatus Omnitrophica bacterium]|nr:glycosyltransferase family 9 protein [Candidatus Omnitrophota bacterium]